MNNVAADQIVFRHKMRSVLRYLTGDPVTSALPVSVVTADTWVSSHVGKRYMFTCIPSFPKYKRSGVHIPDETREIQICAKPQARIYWILLESQAARVSESR